MHFGRFPVGVVELLGNFFELLFEFSDQALDVGLIERELKGLVRVGWVGLGWVGLGVDREKVRRKVGWLVGWLKVTRSLGIEC